MKPSRMARASWATPAGHTRSSGTRRAFFFNSASVVGRWGAAILVARFMFVVLLGGETGQEIVFQLSLDRLDEYATDKVQSYVSVPHQVASGHGSPWPVGAGL